MTVIGIIALLLAAALHVYIYYLESFAWTTKALAIFGTTKEEAEATREMAFNQGFYNLMLAIVALIGFILHLTGAQQVGLALMLTGVGSMLAAALLLFFTSPDKRSAATKQGIFPFIALIFLSLGALI